MSECLPRWATPRTDRPTLGTAARKVADALGLPLMPWQRQVLDTALEYDPVSKRLAYREVILTVPRQQGKSSLLLVLMLTRALWARGQQIRYTAQTGADARRKLIDDWLPALQTTRFGELFRPRLTSGHEALRFTNGGMVGLVATTRRAGHGGTLDTAIIDEAFAQPDARLEQALKPAMVTRDSPQLWIVSTAGTPADSPYLLAKVTAGREIAEAGLTHSVACFEWSAPDDADPGDRATWRACMPALGRTISEEAVEADWRSMDANEFARAYLNRWTTTLSDPVIAPLRWAALADEGTRPTGPVALAYDVAPDRASSSIAVAGQLEDGRWWADMIEHDTTGTGWIVPRLVELCRQYDPVAVVADSYGPGASLLPELERSGVKVTVTGPKEMANACGVFYDAVAAGDFAHAGRALMADAIEGATKRSLGDAWAWNRRRGGVDLSPLVAATLALYGAQTNRRDVPEVWDLNEIVAELRARQATEATQPQETPQPLPVGVRRVSMKEVHGIAR